MRGVGNKTGRQAGRPGGVVLGEKGGGEGNRHLLFVVVLGCCCFGLLVGTVGGLDLCRLSRQVIG